MRSCLLTVTLILGACGASTPTREELAAEIEGQFHAIHPDVPLHRYARFYAKPDSGSAEGIYVYAIPGHEPMVGRAGQVVWTGPDDLPVVHDGGCSVINISFDVESMKLRKVECNVGA